MEDLETDIRQTYEYGLRFGVSYGKEQLWLRLISGRQYDYSQFEKTYTKMKLSVTTIDNQLNNNKIAKAISLAKKISTICKEIEFIGLTGSVAAGYPKNDDDIDLMIVTSEGCLWLTRLWLRLYVLVKRIPHRKYGHAEKKDDFCFNLWMDDSCLKLPIEKQCLKNAMDLIMMIPLYDKDGTYQSIIRENDWAKNFVINGYSKLLKSKNKTKKRYNNSVYKLLSGICFYPQKWYLSIKKEKGLVTDKMAFFHDN